MAGERRYRIGVFKGSVDRGSPSPEVANVLDETARACERLGHHVEEIPIPFTAQIAEDFLDYYASIFFSMTRFGKLFFDFSFDARKVEPFSAEFAARFRKHMLRYPLVLKRLRQAKVVTDRIYQNFDITLCPTVSTPPPRNGFLLDPTDGTDAIVQRMLEFAPFTALQNITGEPAISLPLGLSGDGLPIGMHFSTRYGEDETLLKLAYALEEDSGWNNRKQLADHRKSKV